MKAGQGETKVGWYQLGRVYYALLRGLDFALYVKFFG